MPCKYSRLRSKKSLNYSRRPARELVGLRDDCVIKWALRNDKATAKKLSALFWSVVSIEDIGDIPHLTHSSQQIAQRS